MQLSARPGGRVVLAAVVLVATLAPAVARADERDAAKPAEAPKTDASGGGDANANASADASATAAPPASATAPPAGGEAPPATESNITARASVEFGGYSDSVATTALTPSVAGSVENPVAGWYAGGRYLVDIISAASPDIVSTASPPFKEVRHAGNLAARYKPGTFGVGLSGAASYTPDYLALSGAAQLTQELDDKNLTLVAGYGYGHDTIGRTGTPFSVFSRSLDTHSINAGFSRIVNPSLVLGLYGDAILERGDQSKPYRYIPMFSPQVAPTIPRGASVDLVANSRLEARPLEQLPLTRDRFAVSGKLAWRFNRSTLRVDQRGYGDSWGLFASTTDARYFFDVSDRVTLWPHVRFHVQNAVSFWKRAYAANGTGDLPALRTGDRELGALHNVGLGWGVRWSLGRAGRIDDLVWTTSIDGTWTSFYDAIYVTDRISGLVVTGLEVVF